MTSHPAPRPRRDVLASDAEREHAVADLRHHFAAGRLDSEELERRVDAAYAARSRGELWRLLRDLPRRGRARAAERFYAVQRELLPYHAAAYVTVNGSLTGIWAATGEGRFWPGAVLAPMTMLIATHAFGSRWLRARVRRPR
jgi:hypothetical protein